jgi:4-amino-4-deoxy-L-arabinose transferase-like glycosyltransferase
MLLFLFWSRSLRRLWDRRLGWGILAHLLVILPWFAWVGVETKGEFLEGFFLTHNLSRFTSPMEGHRGSLLYYIVVLPIGLLPWSAFLAPALIALKKATRQEPDDGLSRRPRLPSAARFLISWIAVYLVFFSLSGTKLPNYILPLYPPTAIVVAQFLVAWRTGVVRPPAWVVHTSILTFGLIGVLVAIGMLVAGGKLGGAAVLRDRQLPGLGNAAWAGLILTLVAALAWICVRRSPRLVAPMLAVGAVVFVAVVAADAGRAVNSSKAPRDLAAIVAAHIDEPADVRLACYDYFQPSMVFYTHREVERLGTPDEVRELLRRQLPVFVFVPASTWESIESGIPAPHRQIGRHRDFYRNCDVVIITNR